MFHARERAQRVTDDRQRHAGFRSHRRSGQRVFKVVRAGNADFFSGAQRLSSDDDLPVLHVRAALELLRA